MFDDVFGACLDVVCACLGALLILGIGLFIEWSEKFMPHYSMFDEDENTGRVTAQSDDRGEEEKTPQA